MIDKFLDMVPSWAYALAILLLGLTLGAVYVQLKFAQTELAEFKAQVAEATQRAEAKAREIEQKMQRQTERIANDAAKKQTELAARAATADLVAGSLRDQIGSLNARPTPADPAAAAFAVEARTARELLGACVGRYKGVARDADEIRDQVSGLQDYAKTVCIGAKP